MGLCASNAAEEPKPALPTTQSPQPVAPKPKSSQQQVPRDHKKKEQQKKSNKQPNGAAAPKAHDGGGVEPQKAVREEVEVAAASGGNDENGDANAHAGDGAGGGGGGDSAPQVEVVEDVSERRLTRGMSQRIVQQVEEKRARQRTLTKLQKDFELEMYEDEDGSLKKVIKAMNVFHVSDPELRKRILENWRVLNAEGNGYLNKDEVRLLIEAEDESIPDDQVAELVLDADPERTGKVMPRNFVRSMAHAAAYAAERRNDILEEFRVMDEEGKGFVAREEVKMLLQHAHEELTPEQIEVLLQEARIPNDGQVSEDDYVKLMNEARKANLIQLAV